MDGLAVAWITVDAGLPEHPKLTALPSDAARWSWLVIVCAAKRQRKPGRFADAKHLREVVGRHARHLPAYLAVGLIEPAADGSLAIHDWAEYQRDPTAAARQARHRDGIVTERDSHGNVTDDVTTLARAGALSLSVSLSNPPNVKNLDDGSLGGSADEGDVLTDYRDLTLRYPTKATVRDWLLRLADEYGRTATSAALAAEHVSDPDASTLISRAEGRLAAAADAGRRKRDRDHSAHESARFEVLG